MRAFIIKLFADRKPGLFFSLLIFSLTTPAAYSEKLLILPPPPEVIRGGQIDFSANTPDSEKNNKVAVFYATKRLPTDDGTWYSKQFDDKLRVGKAQLMIGREGLPWGVLHQESMQASDARLEFEITLNSVDQSAELAPDDSLDKLSPAMQAYVNQINEAIAKAHIKDVTVIAHGAFNSFYYAMAEAAQFRFYTGKNAVVIAYSWPGVENNLAYKANVKNAEQSEADFNRLIKILGKHSNAERINVLGYSVGGRLVGGAMAKLADEYAEKDLTDIHKALRLGHMYLTSSDEPIEEFRNYAQKFTQMFDLITVTASYTDPILGRAQLTGGGDRLGRPPKPSDTKHAASPEQKQAILDAVKNNKLHLLNLETSEITGYKFVHGSWYLNPWVSSDVIVSMNLGLQPEQRGLATATKEGAEYPIWIFPPEYVETLRAALEMYKEQSEAGRK
jgi:esterase/lipase superfamily enzyme